MPSAMQRPSRNGGQVDIEAGLPKVSISLAPSKELPAVVNVAPTSCIKGNPGPLGCIGFGMTTVMLMIVTTEWTSTGFIPVVLCYGLFFGGLGQFIAGLFQIIKGATFVGTAFCSYSCFWMGWALLKYLEATATVQTVVDAARTGDTLWCGLWGILSVGFFVVTLRRNVVMVAIFSSLFVTFFLLAGANYSHVCKLAAGYFGLFCGGSALYAGLGMLYEDELGMVLPGLKPIKWI